MVALILTSSSASGQMLGSATSWIQNELFKIHGPLVYVVVAALVFAEVGIVIGFFLPGEIATIIGGVIASEHRANLVLMIVVVVAAAAAGNLSGYELGRIAGPWLVSHRPLRGHAGVAHAERLIARRGGPAVVIGRWIAVVRSVLPGLAGMSDMSRPTFITLSAVGAVGWGTMWVLVGFAVGRTYVKVLNAAGTWSLVALGLLAVAIVAFLVWRKLLERRAHRHGGAGS